MFLSSEKIPTPVIESGYFIITIVVICSKYQNHLFISCESCNTSSHPQKQHVTHNHTVICNVIKCDLYVLQLHLHFKYNIQVFTNFMY